MGVCQILSQMHSSGPTFTENECPDLSGKVFIVTGGYTGVGLSLAHILYAKNSNIYIAGSSPKKARCAFQALRKSHPSSAGSVHFLPLDLSDLTTIRRCAEAFLAQESRLHVLWNFAGGMTAPAGGKTAQGYEPQLGATCLGPFLLTMLLLPVLRATAKEAPPGEVRVLFSGSPAAELAPRKAEVKCGDLDFESVAYADVCQVVYGHGKVGTIFLGKEFARREEKNEEGEWVVFASLNPGYLKSELRRHARYITNTFSKTLFHPPIYGAYTSLFAGLSPALTPDKAGAYIIPRGRFGVLAGDIGADLLLPSQGGSGVAKSFWEWCEGEVRAYA